MAKPDLLNVAMDVSDGSVVDWADVERSAASEAERRVVRNLRLVESLSSFHRSAAAPEAPTAQLPAAEFRWGGLEVRARLGEGAFGEVYRAWDPKLQREVALKLLRHEFSGPGDFARVLHEARLLARVRHGNVVTVHGADRHDERVGLWMELVRGRSLSRMIQEHGRLGAREAAVLGVDLCRALAAVHGAGLVHRDVKAANVMREDGGRVLLMDFGAGTDAVAVAGGSLSGTPRYIAPEVFEGRPATYRSDLYSLGVLLFHLVTGGYPVAAKTTREMLDKLRRREARLLRDERPDLPDAFVRVVERALAWEPDERYATAGQMEQGLAAFLGAESASPAGPAAPPAARRGWIVAAALVVAAGIALTALLMSRSGNKAIEPAPSAPTATLGAYSVEASLYRTNKDERKQRIESGQRLSLGDHLSLEFRSSVPVHLYVIDEDDQGHAFALFPLPDLAQQNPLPGGEPHILPGADLHGKPTQWTVDSAGGREHLLILASPGRLVEFEAELARLPRPQGGSVAVAIPEQAKIRLRGIGTLSHSSAPDARVGEGTRLFEMAEQLATRQETVQGAWLRRIDLENPL